eukprot:TRINITY_DN7677_c0_g1_i1.p1 TRINITY_DN7677_c0_g1~~TRINITY_DN7677_c0_g1_i1.p1  ORF type:complete len:452 (+),score=104.81 TRINITY_DN7677_c0_g1_i1:119-1474(+)
MAVNDVLTLQLPLIAAVFQAITGTHLATLQETEVDFGTDLHDNARHSQEQSLRIGHDFLQERVDGKAFYRHNVSAPGVVEDTELFERAADIRDYVGFHFGELSGSRPHTVSGVSFGTEKQNQSSETTAVKSSTDTSVQAALRKATEALAASAAESSILKKTDQVELKEKEAESRALGSEKVHVPERRHVDEQQTSQKVAEHSQTDTVTTENDSSGEAEDLSQADSNKDTNEVVGNHAVIPNFEQSHQSSSSEERKSQADLEKEVQERAARLRAELLGNPCTVENKKDELTVDADDMSLLTDIIKDVTDDEELEWAGDEDGDKVLLNIEREAVADTAGNIQTLIPSQASPQESTRNLASFVSSAPQYSSASLPDMMVRYMQSIGFPGGSPWAMPAQVNPMPRVPGAFSVLAPTVQPPREDAGNDQGSLASLLEETTWDAADDSDLFQKDRDS